ncbi:hypothetical protein HDC37_002617 [Microbacterium sp. AK009]|nr:hypothetical protein [Microbacterium sp. AK009]
MTVQAFVALTAAIGGAALIVGTLLPSLATVLMPPLDYLSGSPFSSYLIPGLALILVVGGTHTAALVLTLARSPWSAATSALAGFACLAWIFVQMIYIPFSVLQLVYAALGAAELALTMLTMGIWERRRVTHRSTFVADSRPQSGRTHRV